MRVSQHMIDEAQGILSKRLELPQQTTSAPSFFVSHEQDASILAFTAIEHGGSGYKIGTKKQVS